MLFAHRPVLDPTPTKVAGEEQWGEAGSVQVEHAWEPSGVGTIDPMIFGIDPSDVGAEAGPVGAGAGSRASKVPVDPHVPMSGRQADELIDGIGFLRDAVTNDIQNGITGERRIHLHDDFESYVEAWYRDSLQVRSVWDPASTPQQNEAARRQVARSSAAAHPGFTHPYTNVAHIYTKGTPAFVTIHELIHVHTHPDLFSIGEVLVEGVADYFTGVVCESYELPFEASYAPQRRAIQLLAAEVGNALLAQYVFSGQDTAVREIVDSKGAGTWKGYTGALGRADYARAAELLRGAGALHHSTLAVNDANNDVLDDAKRTMHAFDGERAQATWGAEGTEPVRGRVVKAEVRQGQAVGYVPRGGRAGVRPNWAAFLHLDDGRTMTSRIFEVESEGTLVELPNLGITGEVDEIELVPAR